MSGKLKIKTLRAKSVSYGAKRNRKSVSYIVIHYTGNRNDTAKNNAKYFATSNTRAAGAHFFIDKGGAVWKSIPMNRTAYAVGGLYSTSNGAGSYYKECSNANSVSIELCDLANGSPSWDQMVAAKKLVEYIQKYCPNAKTIIRHWDVNGKACPATMVGKDNKKWNHFHNYVTKGYQFKGQVTQKASIRLSGKVTDDNKIGTKKGGATVYITKIVGNWGRLKRKTADGKYRWISLNKVKEL